MYKYTRVRSLDSDVFFFITLHYARMYANITILFDTGSGKNMHNTEMAESFSQIYYSALLCLHAFTGCDNTSAMKGRTKGRPLAILQKSPDFEEFFFKLGTDWTIKIRHP